MPYTRYLREVLIAVLATIALAHMQSAAAQGSIWVTDEHLRSFLEHSSLEEIPCMPEQLEQVEGLLTITEPAFCAVSGTHAGNFYGLYLDMIGAALKSGLPLLPLLQDGHHGMIYIDMMDGPTVAGLRWLRGNQYQDYVVMLRVIPD